MESRILKVLTVLGVPGVAIGVFYLLLRIFSFEFSAIDPTWSALIAIVFLLVVGGVTAFALHRWSPTTSGDKRALPKIDRKSQEPFVFVVGEEIVTFEEKMRSVPLDIIKINAHDHFVGVSAEYAWLQHHYPNCATQKQALTTLELITGRGDYESSQLHFDRISIKLNDGRKKDIYFDISSFFGGGTSSVLDPAGFAARKISEAYS